MAYATSQDWPLLAWGASQTVIRLLLNYSITRTNHFAEQQLESGAFFASSLHSSS